MIQQILERIRRMARWRRGADPGFVILENGGRIPTRGSAEAAGLDLYAPSSRTLDPGVPTMVELNISSEFRAGWVAHIWDRSGMAKKGIHRMAGVVDSDYRGEWKLILLNTTDEPYVINKGDRIAQAVFVPCYVGMARQIVRASETDRGDGGYGSTGR